MALGKFIKIFGAVLLLLMASAGIYFYPQLYIATGYAAKKICTCTLATGRQLEEVESNDLYFSILGLVSNEIDTPTSTVTSTIFGLSPHSAVYKPGIGCVLLEGSDDYKVRFPVTQQLQMPAQDTAFNAINRMTSGVDASQLSVALDHAFDADGRLDHKRTSAVVVIHRDTLIAEKYAGPFDANVPQLGWSMTKSLMNTFAGMLSMEGKLDRHQKNLFEAWAVDGRKDITLTHLLHMNTGLAWEEDYASVSDATRMLYKSEDVSIIPLSKPLAHELGKTWYYSSGTSNLLSKYFRNKIGDDPAYLTYLKTHLFDELGMSSAFIETDESGTFIGSSYGYATPRDWAKFGLLYLHDGVWKGKRLLPEGWVSFTGQAAAGSNGIYGAQFWLNQKGIQYPDAPQDILIADGFQGQFVFIIPSYDVVIVRMGTGGEYFDTNQFLKEVLAALPKK